MLLAPCLMMERGCCKRHRDPRLFGQRAFMACWQLLAAWTLELAASLLFTSGAPAKDSVSRDSAELPSEAEVLDQLGDRSRGGKENVSIDSFLRLEKQHNHPSVGVFLDHSLWPGTHPAIVNRGHPDGNAHRDSTGQYAAFGRRCSTAAHGHPAFAHGYSTTAHGHAAATDRYSTAAHGHPETTYEHA